MAKKWDNLKKKMSKESQARVDTRVKETLAAMPLAEIRKAIGMTQAQLAETLEVGQGSVSKMENATDMYLSTLRRFVEAAGGELIITASFPDKGELVIEHLSSVPGASALKKRSA